MRNAIFDNFLLYPLFRDKEIYQKSGKEYYKQQFLERNSENIIMKNNKYLTVAWSNVFQSGANKW